MEMEKPGRNGPVFLHHNPDSFIGYHLPMTHKLGHIPVDAATLDMSGAIDATNVSKRAMLRIHLTEVEGYTPTPQAIADIHGKPTASGIVEILEEDGEKLAVFLNPKDSGGIEFSHGANSRLSVKSIGSLSNGNLQKYPLEGGVLILPADSTEALKAMLGALNIPEAKANVVTMKLSEFDALLKNAHGHYVANRQTPDIYASNATKQFPNGAEVPPNHTQLDGITHGYQKEAVIKFRRFHLPTHVSPKDPYINGVQIYDTRFVVVQEGETLRAVAEDYAVKNFISLNKTKLNWAEIPSENLLENPSVLQTLLAKAEGIGEFLGGEKIAVEPTLNPFIARFWKQEAPVRKGLAIALPATLVGAAIYALSHRCRQETPADALAQSVAAKAEPASRGQ